MKKSNYTSTTLPPSESDKQGYNKRWFADNPALTIYRPETGDQVATAFSEILTNSDLSASQVKVTCGRHCYEGFVYDSKAKYIIDVTGLKGYGTTTLPGNDKIDAIYLDVGMGNWDAFRLLNNLYQKVLPAGSCYSVGLGGHITGGGYGVFSRQYGLTIDYLVGADIVIQTGATTAVNTHVSIDSANPYQDLMFGLRGGGGGQFGVITRLYFDQQKLPTTPDYVYVSTISWPWFDSDGNTIMETQWVDILLLFESTFTDQSESSWPMCGMFHATHMDAKSMSMAYISTYEPSLHGDRDEFEEKLKKFNLELRKKAAAIAPISEEDTTLVGHPYIPSTNSVESFSDDGEIKRQYTFLEGVQQLNASGPNRFGKYKSAYHTMPYSAAMQRNAFAALVTPVKRSDGSLVDMSQSLIQFDGYGGKINQVASGATAISQRSSIMKLQYQTYWDSDSKPGNVDTELENLQVAWINDMYSSIYVETGGTPISGANTRTDGCYFNYCDIYIGSRDTDVTTPSVTNAWSLYFGNNVTKLQGLAKKYNPQGWFGNSQTFSPALNSSEDECD